MPQNISILCPHCQKEVSLDDALTHQLQNKFKQNFEIELSKQKTLFEIQLQKEKTQLWKIAQEKAQEKIKNESQVEMKLLKDELELKQKALETAQNAELEIRKLKNRLDEEKRVFELEKQRQLDEERGKIKHEVTKILSEEHQLKDAEKDKTIGDMLKTIEELKRKAQQGSQQLQGEVLELELEELLKKEFPYDEIIPISKGIQGADILQKVNDRNGLACGSITWESKRTKAWSDGWISKLKDDQRGAKADIAVLVTSVLPPGIRNFGTREGIYICNFDSIVGTANILRTTLIQLSMLKLSNVGKNEKMEIIYNYLSGTEFRNRVEAIVESFTTMRFDLEREKRAFVKIWAKREKQIQKVIDNTVGMHGDLQGLMGTALPKIKSLELDNVQEELDLLI